MTTQARDLHGARRAIRSAVAVLVGALVLGGAAAIDTATAVGETGKLTARVWFDRNGDGRYQAEEPPAAGRTVTFTSPDYTTSRTTVASGWVGAILPVGCYTVRLDGTDPITAIPIRPDAPEPRAVLEAADLADTNRALSTSRGFQLCTDATTPAGNIGIRPAGTNNLAVRVWDDANANGVHDTGERGIPGFKLTLSDVIRRPGDTSRWFPTKTTTSTGWVGWSLPRGTCGFVIVPGEFFTKPGGQSFNGPWSPTVARSVNPETENDWIGPYAPFCVSGRDVSLAIGLLNIDDQRFAGPTIAGTVWADTNTDGQRQGAEPLISQDIRIDRGFESEDTTCRGDWGPVVDGNYRFTTSNGLRCITAVEEYGTFWETRLPWGGGPLDRLTVYAAYADLASPVNATVADVGSETTDNDFSSGASCGFLVATCASIVRPPTEIVFDLGVQP